MEKVPSTIYYLLPLNPLVNELVTTRALPLRCPEEATITLPERGEQQVYVVSKTEVDVVRRSKQNLREGRDFCIYLQRNEAARVTLSKPPQNKTRRAKAALERTDPRT